MKHILSAFPLTVLFFAGLSFTTHANIIGSDTRLKGENLRAVFSDTIMVGEYQEYRDITPVRVYFE